MLYEIVFFNEWYFNNNVWYYKKWWYKLLDHRVGEDTGNCFFKLEQTIALRWDFFSFSWNSGQRLFLKSHHYPNSYDLSLILSLGLIVIKLSTAWWFIWRHIYRHQEFFGALYVYYFIGFPESYEMEILLFPF